MSVATCFRHRANIERLTSGEDAYGNTLPATWGMHLPALHVFWYQPKIGPGEIQGERNLNLYGAQMLVPWETDIRESDRVNGVKDRLGDWLTDEVFGIVKIVYRQTHLLVTLEVVS